MVESFIFYVYEMEGINILVNGGLFPLVYKDLVILKQLLILGMACFTSFVYNVAYRSTDGIPMRAILVDVIFGFIWLHLVLALFARDYEAGVRYLNSTYCEYERAASKEVVTLLIVYGTFLLMLNFYTVYFMIVFRGG